MAPRPSTFRQTDITKAVKGAQAGGVEVAKVEIDRTGKIVVFTTKAALAGEPETDFDRWKQDHASSS